MQAIEATGAIDAQGQLSLDQPLGISQPSRVRVIVLLCEIPEPPPAPHTRPIWERVANISAQISPEEWATLPKDLSKNLDHYLYGAPKEDA